MTQPIYRVTKLAAGSDLAAFDCGVPAYNEWLIEHAARSVASGSSMVYLLLGRATPDVDERVVGYYAICPTLVVRGDVPTTLQGGLLRSAPAWLLAKLAIDRSMRGDREHRWGAQLLREALERIVSGADLAGGQIIVVDADNPHLVAWYVSHGFLPAGGSSLRLYMKVATARKYLGRD